MTLKDALKRIEELERKVKELEGRPAHQFHYHHQPLPQGWPYYTQPVNPGPYMPCNWPQIWCGNVGAGGIGGEV
jgi:hypothetical protein